MARRGLIFFALDLHSMRCASCDTDLIYRSEPPAVCPYCGGLTVDLVSILASMNQFWDALNNALIEMGRVLSAWCEESLRQAAKLGEEE